jgi:hypothetical protein
MSGMTMQAGLRRIASVAALVAVGGCGQTGWGVPVGITLQVSSIDFGAVATGTVASQTLAISNQSEVDVTAIIGPPQGPGAPFFDTDPPANGTLALKAGEVKLLKISYAPQAETPDPAEAYFSLRWCESSNACISLVNLRGQR